MVAWGRKARCISRMRGAKHKSDISGQEPARAGLLGSRAAASQLDCVVLLALASGKHSSSALPAARRHPLPNPATYPREL